MLKILFLSRKCHSASAAQLNLLVPLPDCMFRWADLAAKPALDPEATALASSTGQALELAVFMHALADPVDSGVVTDSLVIWVDHDDLIPVVSSISSNPIGVENTEFTHFPASSLLCNAFQVACCFHFCHTMILGLPIHNALEDILLAATTLHADT